ncbi:hypothetical protein AMTRI_Chr10g1460 [Amborella trichopoda]
MFGGQSFVRTARGDNICTIISIFILILFSSLFILMLLFYILCSSLSLSLNEVICDEVVKDIKISIKIHILIYQARKYHSSNNCMVGVIVIRSWNVV